MWAGHDTPLRAIEVLNHGGHACSAEGVSDSPDVVGFENAHVVHVGSSGQRHRYGPPGRSVEMQSNRARRCCTYRPNVIRRIARYSPQKVVGSIIGCRLLAEGYGCARAGAYFLTTHSQIK